MFSANAPPISTPTSVLLLCEALSCDILFLDSDIKKADALTSLLYTSLKMHLTQVIRSSASTLPSQWVYKSEFCTVAVGVPN